MARVDFACEGQLLFSTKSSTREGQTLPRIGEAMVVEQAHYVVVDVEYWARRAGAEERRELWPVVHLLPLDAEAWAQRMERRRPAPERGKAPVRY